MARSRVVLVALASFLGSLAMLTLAAERAGADDCSSDSDCEQTGGYNGAIAVIGGIAAVAAAAAAAAARTPEGEETDLAILQIDIGEVNVAQDEPAVVTLTGWHAGSDGQPKRVGMSIWIDVPAGCGIVVEPATGEGQVVATISLDVTEPSDVELVELVAHGAWGGKEATETITVHVTGPLELRLY